MEQQQLFKLSARLNCLRRLESMLENLDGFERDMSDFEMSVERYNFHSTQENLEIMTDKQYELMKNYYINNEREFKSLHLSYQIKLMESLKEVRF